MSAVYTMGCIFHGCHFTAGGEALREQMRAHLVDAHGVDPTNPEIPADARRGER